MEATLKTVNLPRICTILFAISLAIGSAFIAACDDEPSQTDSVSQSAEAPSAALENTSDSDQQKETDAANEQREKDEGRLKAQQEQEQRTAEETARKQAANSMTVYIASSGNGEKYHSNPSCSRMKNATAITVSEAQGLGYTPCAKCC